MMFGRKKEPSMLINSVVPERLRCSLCGVVMEVRRDTDMRWYCLHGAPNEQAARCFNAGVKLRVDPKMLNERR